MIRTTITMPEELAQLVAREGRRLGTSVSEVVRQALIAHLGAGTDTPRTIPFAKLGRSGHRHTARDAERILAREWTGVRRR